MFKGWLSPKLLAEDRSEAEAFLLVSLWLIPPQGKRKHRRANGIATESGRDCGRRASARSDLERSVSPQDQALLPASQPMKPSAYSKFRELSKPVFCSMADRPFRLSKGKAIGNAFELDNLVRCRQSRLPLTPQCQSFPSRIGRPQPKYGKAMSN